MLYKSLLKNICLFLCSFSFFVYGNEPKFFISDPKRLLYLASNKGHLTVDYRYGHAVDIHFAVKRGYKSLIEDLVEANPNVIHKRDEFGNSPLHWAVKYNFLEIIQMLLELGADLNAKNIEGQSPLFFAYWRGEVEVIELLLERGADPGIMDNNGFFPREFIFWPMDIQDIHDVLGDGSRQEKPKILNITDKFGNSPLHSVAKYSSVEVIRRLLDWGADPNAQNKWGQSPLFFAYWRGEVEVIELLLEKGADPSLRDNNGFAPWDISFWPTDIKTRELLGPNSKTAVEEGCLRMFKQAPK